MIDDVVVLQVKIRNVKNQVLRRHYMRGPANVGIRRVAVAAFVLALLLLSACGGEEGAEEPTATPTPVEAQLEATTAAVEEATATSAPPATETAAPVETAAPTDTVAAPEPTETEEPVASETATPEETTPPSEQPAEIESRGALMLLVPEATLELGWDRQELLEECETFRDGCTPPLFTPAGPLHLVQLDAFYIDATEVTNAAYVAFLNEIESHTEVCFGQDCIGLDRSNIQQQGESAYELVDSAMGEHPVTGVTWFGAAAFCQWRGARLPTSAEWETAASWNPERDEKMRYPWGNEFDTSAANFCDVNCDAHSYADEEADDGFARTAPVGSFPGGSSPIGALDMAGNVWEWVLDWFNDDYYDQLIEAGVFPVVNPSGPETSDRRVVRGGSWFDTGNFTSSVFRAGIDPTLSDDTLGFRCAVDG